MWHELRTRIQTGDPSAHKYLIRAIGTNGTLPPIEYSCHY
jgi:hypothetical protein